MKLSLLMMLLLLAGCKSGEQQPVYSGGGAAKGEQDLETKYPDDTYCATVGYRNPNTSTVSSYTLTVVVENNEVIELNWPNGGVLDQDHFEAAALDENGHAELISDKGYNYSVDITGKSEGCLEKAAPAKQCIGITKKGSRCRHVTDNSNQLCWQHQKQAK